MDLTIRIGGEAGQRLQLIGVVLAKLFSRHGLHVFTHQDYMSRIRGGHNYYQIRISENTIASSVSVQVSCLSIRHLNGIWAFQEYSTACS
ncbi:MAG: 2-oxoacid:acceptor oxidoreductase family protein [Deltaproteobacteria bacterium]|jgi:Pyruvate/2-oxoacid:ferredoxin oxidoreductase gamma subunit|nr:2-oxoacid:acceptor oxidoreductase family protein [Deltaproteobacteria bacterium]